MKITAALVKQLRDRTGSSMMDCKKALVETEGDIDAAIEVMRKAGLAKADKKSGRVAADGRIVAKIAADGSRAALVEVNSETDFVAKNEDFSTFAAQVAEAALLAPSDDITALSGQPFPGESGKTIEEKRQELVAKLGENITLRRMATLQAGDGEHFGAYMHGSRIGVIVRMAGGSDELAKDVAMHIAASKPTCISEEDVPAELLAKEKEILTAQAADSGKPAEIIEKMIGGRIKKFINEITLTGQPFIKDPDINVGKLLSKNDANVSAFVRFEVGEGIEKKEDNFAEEVMAQVNG
ncbi:MAG: elongation factor Ts [Gammaproteobacteria bacterium]|nr:MAG: elongation factor Ts [Gammaproteobacteria bacterium]